MQCSVLAHTHVKRDKHQAVKQRHTRAHARAYPPTHSHNALQSQLRPTFLKGELQHAMPFPSRTSPAAARLLFYTSLVRAHCGSFSVVQPKCAAPRTCHFLDGHPRVVCMGPWEEEGDRPSFHGLKSGGSEASGLARIRSTCTITRDTEERAPSDVSCYLALRQSHSASHRTGCGPPLILWDVYR